MCGYYAGSGEIIICEHKEIVHEECPATCTDMGYSREFCAMCGVILSETYYESFGHMFVDGKCQNCGTVKDENGDYVDGEYGEGEYGCAHEYDEKGMCVICGKFFKENDFVVVG